MNTDTQKLICLFALALFLILGVSFICLAAHNMGSRRELKFILSGLGSCVGALCALFRYAFLICN